MTLEHAAGRVLLAGFESKEFDPALDELLSQVRPAGVIFFRRNVAGAPEFAALVQRIRRFYGECFGGDSFPVLAVDQEGGTVDRFRDALSPFPSARAVAASGDDPFMRRFGALIGRTMAAFGLNVNFAPTVDLAGAESEPVMAPRTVSPQAAEVVRFARNFLDGMARYDLLGCAKHFPGLGSGALDTHAGMAEIAKPAEQLWDEDLLPFRNLHEDLLLVLVGHAWYPSLHDPGAEPRPASLSPAIINGLLREKIGFRGVVVADDLEMGAVVGPRSPGDVAVAAIEAGCDLLPICRSADRLLAAHRALLDRARRHDKFAERLEEAAGRVAVLQNALQRVARERTAESPDWQELREDISELYQSAEGMSETAAAAPRFSANAARPARRGPGGGGGGPRGRGGPRGGPRDRDRGGRGDRRGGRPDRGDRGGPRRHDRPAEHGDRPAPSEHGPHGGRPDRGEHGERPRHGEAGEQRRRPRHRGPRPGPGAPPRE